MSDHDGALFADPRRQPTSDGPGPVERAAEVTIEALRTAGGIDATHTLKIELIRQGAKALDRELCREKVTVAAIGLFNRVSEIADALPTVQQAMSDAFDRMAAHFEDPSAPSLAGANSDSAGDVD